MSYSVAVVGTGDPEQSDGYAMAYRHARGYERRDDCELIACVDTTGTKARKFSRTFDIEQTGVYEEYERMVVETQPDIVSVCTPTNTHAEIVMECAASDAVGAVHCEKPMAATWKECREMVAACEEHGVQLTFNHQRRFATPYRKAKAALDVGLIGELRRIELGGHDLYDYGTHLFDMCGYLTDQCPVEWVFGQIDPRDPAVVYGLYQETQALARWRYESGVEGLASTGDDGFIDCELRLVGDDGAIEVGSEGGPTLRVRDSGSAWMSVRTGMDGIWRSRLHPLDKVLRWVPVGDDRWFSDPTYVDRAIADVVESLDTNRPSALAADHALQTTEIIFACWESARRGERVELPLVIDDNPLEAIVERGSSAIASSPLPLQPLDSGRSSTS
ncbi:MAG: Gfo/Idh/MocA family protein [Halobacteriota archaeon]|uniref:Gfo/Idh/MocA family protein n=1 Tax=Natronomonas sp. TaxID=2184060 RepID=UPI0039765C1A